MRYSEETHSELIEAMKRALGGVLDYIQDPDVTDINYNSTSNELFVDGIGMSGGSGFVYTSEKAEMFINTVAEYHGVEINQGKPTLSKRLPPELSSCRLQANMNPVTPGFSFSLRKPGALYPIDDYVNQQTKQHIRKALVEKKNILLIGSTGAGKTSFLNSILAEMALLLPDERLIILEDTRELQCSHANHEFLLTVKNRKDEVVISMANNLSNSLRLNPDRLIVGEVRESQAASMVLEAWDTGHEGGMCTLHGKSAIDGYERFCRLSKLDEEKRSDVKLAAKSIGLVFYLSNIEGERKVREVVSVTFNKETQKPYFEFLYSFDEEVHKNTNVQINGQKPNHKS